MSLKNTLAAAGIAAAFTAPAFAQDAPECADKQNPFDALNIADDLFSNPVANWNVPFLKTLNEDTLADIQKEAGDVHGEVSRSTDRTLQQLARTLDDGKTPRWEKILEDAHPVVKPFLEKIEAGSKVDDVTSDIRDALTQYESDIKKTLGEIADNSTPACAVFTAPAPETPTP